MEFEIGEERYKALIDTGSSFSFLRKDVLEKIQNKKLYSHSEMMSYKGDRYLTVDFQVPQIKIGNLFTESVITEEIPDFWKNGSTLGYQAYLLYFKLWLLHEVYREGLIGRNVLEKYTCIFDFPHAHMFLAEKPLSLEQAESLLTMGFASLPFEMTNAGPVFTFQTDFGDKKFILDTGATHSIVRLSEDEKKYFGRKRKISTGKLMGNGINFGKHTFLIIDMAAEQARIDGIVGLDFFKQNTICFDYEHKIAYIQTPKLGSKERFNYWWKSWMGR